MAACCTCAECPGLPLSHTVGQVSATSDGWIEPIELGHSLTPIERLMFTRLVFAYPHFLTRGDLVRKHDAAGVLLYSPEAASVKSNICRLRSKIRPYGLDLANWRPSAWALVEVTT